MSMLLNMAAELLILVATLPWMTSDGRYELDWYQRDGKAGQGNLWERKSDRRATTCEDRSANQLCGSPPDEPNESRTLIEGCYGDEKSEATVVSPVDSEQIECRRLEWIILTEGWIGAIRSGADWIGTSLMLWWIGATGETKWWIGATNGADGWIGAAYERWIGAIDYVNYKSLGVVIVALSMSLASFLWLGWW